MFRLLPLTILTLTLISCTTKSSSIDNEATGNSRAGVFKTFLYVTNSADGTISSFELTESDGEPAFTVLQTINTGDSISEPWQVIANAAQDTLYVGYSGANAVLNGIQSFTIAPETGLLAASRFFDSTGNRVFGMNFSRNEDFLLAANYDTFQGCNLYALDSVDGLIFADRHDNNLSSPLEVVAHPALDVFYVVNSGSDSIEVARYNIIGEPEQVEQEAASDTPVSLAMHRNAKVLIAVHNSSLDSIIQSFAISASDGSLTSLVTATSNSAANSMPRHVVMHPTLDVFYVVNENASNVGTYSINPTTGAFAQLGTNAAGSVSWSAAIDPTGKFLVVPNMQDDNLSVFNINQTTGALTAAATPTLAAGDGPRYARFVRIAQ